MPDAAETIQNALFERFGERIDVDASLPGLDELARIAARRVCIGAISTAMFRRNCCACCVPAR